MEQVLAGSEGATPLALRNRAMLELVYSAGLRSAEAVGLDLGDVDFEQEHVHVRNGKGAGYRRRARSARRPRTGSAATSATRARRSRAAPVTPSSLGPRAAGSTPRPCAG